jgi:Holliday junction resolvasome RuvABC endonuclease subunit
MTCILGVDPGIHGALAIVAINDGGIPKLIAILDVPVIGTGAKERINTMLVRDWLVQHAPDHALIERAGSMPKQGVASTFKYARAVGSLETVVACSDIPYSLIEPAAWKKFHHLPGKDKEAARLRVLQLFPGDHTLFARKLDHQRAEAVLIALTPVPGVLPRAVFVEHAEPTEEAQT